MLRIAIALLSILILAACLPSDTAEPTVEYQLGELIFQDNFDELGAWETFGFAETAFGVSEGVYNAISTGGGYITVANSEYVQGNVVMEVTTQQGSENNNNSYGIVCRAQAANTTVAYYFLISGDGEYGIRIGESTAIRVLVPWTESSAINQGQAQNTLRVVCIDDYLAFYINDQFIAEAWHDWLTVGSVGFTVNSQEGTLVAIQYDDLKIWEAELVGDTEE
jgi:hypothetical protein